MEPNIYELLVPANLANHPSRAIKSIKYITIHTTGNHNPGATAEAHARFQFNGGGGRQASWHYTVDEKEIWQSFRDEQMCWHTGTRIGNETSIGIEICVNSRNGFENACENCAWLTALLLRLYGLDTSQVVQHHHWSGKNCPAELRSAIWEVSWNDFLAMVRRHMGDEADAGCEVIAALRSARITFDERHWPGVLQGTVSPNKEWVKVLTNRIIDSRWEHFTPEIIGTSFLALLGHKNP